MIITMVNWTCDQKVFASTPTHSTWLL